MTASAVRRRAAARAVLSDRERGTRTALHLRGRLTPEQSRSRATSDVAEAMAAIAQGDPDTADGIFVTAVHAGVRASDIATAIAAHARATRP